MSNIMWNSQRRHPTADRYLIDFGIVNVMEPMTMAGAIFGSLLNKLLPEWITLSLLAVVLGGVSYKTYNSGVARWEKENRAAVEPAPTEASSVQDEIPNEKSALMGAERGPQQYQATYLSDKLEICRGEDAYDGAELDPLDQAFEAHFAQNESANQQEINAILERERHVPWDMMAVNHAQGALARPLTRTWT